MLLERFCINSVLEKFKKYAPSALFNIFKKENADERKKTICTKILTLPIKTEMQLVSLHNI